MLFPVTTYPLLVTAIGNRIHGWEKLALINLNYSVVTQTYYRGS